MIKYMLAGNLAGEPNHHMMQNVRELTEDEIINFSNAINALIPFNITYSLFEICEENFRALENYIKELSLFSGGNQLDFHNVIIKWNTLTLNFLASFRLFIDHQETILARNDSSTISTYEKFKERTAQNYDSHFSYRFLWNLRNYIQHCGLPACSWEFSEMNDQVGIFYDRDGLLKGFDWKKLKSELASKPERIEVTTLIRELHSSIVDIAQYTANLHISKLYEPFSFLSDLINEVIATHPNAEPIILKFDAKEDTGKGAQLIGLVFFPLRIMTNIRSIIY